MKKEKEEVNNISPELLGHITPLKKGETAVYELLGGVDYRIKNADESVTTAKIYPAIQQLMSRAVIYDKGHEENIKIGYVTSPATKEKDPKYGTIEFKASNGSRIYVTDAKRDKVLYNFLELHPENQDNVNPDKVAPAGGYTFKRVKPEATAAEKLAESDKKLFAAAVLRKLTEDEIRELAKSFGLDSTKSEAEVTLEIDELIKKDIRVARTVTSREHNAVIQTNVLLEDAQKLEVIAFKADNNEWNWVDTGRKIIGQQAGDPLVSLKKYMVETETGETFHDNLKKAVESARNKKAKKK